MRDLADALTQAGQLVEAADWWIYALDRTPPMIRRMNSYSANPPLTDGDIHHNFPDGHGNFYRILVHNSNNSVAMRRMATVMELTGQTQRATMWFMGRAQAGDQDALREGMRMIARHQPIENAVTWLEQIAHSGNTHAMRHVAFLSEWRGDIDRALYWWRTIANTRRYGAAETGKSFAFRRGAGLLQRHRRFHEAAAWAQAADELSAKGL